MGLTALEAANVLCAAARTDSNDVVKTCFHKLDELRRLLEPTIVRMMSADVHTVGDVARRDNLCQSAAGECERLHRLHFAPVQDADAISHDFADTANGGRAAVDDWECSAIALQDIYEQRHKRFPDECLLLANGEPVSRHTASLHLIRFRELNRATKGQMKSTGELRKLLCGQCKSDLEAAGLVAVATDGFLNAEHEPTHWILDAKQLDRIKKQMNTNSIRCLPVELLKRIQFQIDHSDPSCYYGKRGALHSGDVLVNFTLTPRWLNLLPQWKDGFCPAKIAYMGYVGYQLFRLYRIAVACGPEIARKVNRDLDDLFSRGDTCFREDILVSAWKRIGGLRKSPQFATRLLAAAQSFVSNTNSGRGQRRINAMFKRAQAQIDNDLGGPSSTAAETAIASDEEPAAVEGVEPVAKRQKVDVGAQTDSTTAADVGVPTNPNPTRLSARMLRWSYQSTASMLHERGMLAHFIGQEVFKGRDVVSVAEMIRLSCGIPPLRIRDLLWSVAVLKSECPPELLERESQVIYLKEPGYFYAIPFDASKFGDLGSITSFYGGTTPDLQFAFNRLEDLHRQLTVFGDGPKESDELSIFGDGPEEKSAHPFFMGKPIRTVDSDELSIFRDGPEEKSAHPFFEPNRTANSDELSIFGDGAENAPETSQ